MPHHRLLSVIGVLLSASCAYALDPTCKLLAEANAKIYARPAHMYQTEKAAYTAGKMRSSELIYINNKTYVMISGKWSISPTTPQKMAEMQKEAQQTETGMTCNVVRDEVVNGEAATLYHAVKKTPDVNTDSQIWISKSKGLPVKLEMDMDVGGSDGKSHRSIRYEYTNVAAPAGLP